MPFANRPENDFELTKCPVCRLIFGERDKTAVFKAHCDECLTTFWWRPWVDKPSAVMDTERQYAKRYCGKNGCVCR